MQRRGRIVMWSGARKYGFLHHDGPDIFFSRAWWNSKREPRVGLECLFVAEPDPVKPGFERARDVTPIDARVKREREDLERSERSEERQQQVARQDDDVDVHRGARALVRANADCAAWVEAVDKWRVDLTAQVNRNEGVLLGVTDSRSRSICGKAYALLDKVAYRRPVLAALAARWQLVLVAPECAAFCGIIANTIEECMHVC